MQAFDEVLQREQLTTIELGRHFNQLSQVGHLARSEMFGEQRGVVAGALDGPSQQAGQRQSVLHGTQFRQHLTREAQSSLLLIIEEGGRLSENTFVQSQPVAAESLNRVIAQVEERRPQDADQSDQVIGIVKVSAEVEQIEHLLLREEGFAADEVVIEAVASQRRLVLLDVRQRAEQDHDVTRLDPPQHGLAGGVLRADARCRV